MSSGKVKSITDERSISLKLAHLMQQWSEICKRGIELEISPELQYYMAGRADAHAMDASRARSAASTFKTERLPAELTQFSRAYEVMVKMLAAFSATDIPDEARIEEEFEEPIEVPELFQMEGTALQRLRERALNLQRDDTEFPLQD